MRPIFLCTILYSFAITIHAQEVIQNSVPPSNEFTQKYYTISNEISAQRIESDIRRLADFGTRNTLSDTVSNTWGIGAARRWIKSEFEQISKDCGNCLEVFYVKELVKSEESKRIPVDTWVVNVVAIQRGQQNPNSMVLMSGDIDSRNSDASDYKKAAPGANDNASGMAGTIEAARVLSKHTFANSIVYLGLSGEEQGLFGGRAVAKYAKEQKWDIIGVLNNDMIGNIEGVDGVIDNRSFRIFSEPVPVTETDQERNRRRYTGGEVDGISRQLARYIHRLTQAYLPHLKPMMVYRLDRFGRGGHHKPFNDLGFAGVRIMESHEYYPRQHQDIREENGKQYGDVIEGVNFDYAKQLTTVNAICLASLAWAPRAPQEVSIGGAVQASTTLKWSPVPDKQLAGYKIYWRETTAPQWQYARFVPKSETECILQGIVIDNYYFGVAAIDEFGNESVVRFPNK